MNKITTQIKAITPQYAGQLMIHNKLNRPLNRTTVEDYKSQMLKGLWVLNGEPIILSDQGTLLDGQHRLVAVQESGVTIQAVIVSGVDESTFATMDTGRNRTISDLFNIEEIPNAAAIGSIITSYFRIIRSTGSGDHQDSIRKLKLSKAEILGYYKDNATLLQKIYKFSARCRSKLSVMKISEIGSLYLYLHKMRKHSTDKIEAFFEELVNLRPTTNKTVSRCSHQERSR